MVDVGIAGILLLSGFTTVLKMGIVEQRKRASRLAHLKRSALTFV